MKVIQEGDGRTGWAKEFECTGAGNGNGGCGAILLVEQGDLYHTYNHDYGGGKETFITFKCPECGNETDVKGVPSSISIASKDPAKSRGWRD
jgi:hypothetical protein